MADTARQVIDALYDAMKSGDTARTLSMLSADVEVVVPGPAGVGAAGQWRGIDGARECFRRLGEGQETEHVEFFERIAEGTTVDSRLHVRAVVKKTGKRFESDIVHIFTVSNGKVIRLLDFFDTAALVAAYGTD
jgi:ketosteroid isomerase-like protein